MKSIIISSRYIVLLALLFAASSCSILKNANQFTDEVTPISQILFTVDAPGVIPPVTGTTQIQPVNGSPDVIAARFRHDGTPSASSVVAMTVRFTGNISSLTVNGFTTTASGVPTRRLVQTFPVSGNTVTFTIPSENIPTAAAVLANTAGPYAAPGVLNIAGGGLSAGTPTTGSTRNATLEFVASNGSESTTRLFAVTMIRMAN